MLAFLLAYVALLTIAVRRNDSGQGVASGLLLGNWVLNSAFVHFSGCDFPWQWYLTVDWLTAFTLWIDRETAWQRLLVASYAVELLMHAAYAYVTRDVDAMQWSATSVHLYWTQWWYCQALSMVAWAQIALVGSWIGYDTARDMRSRRGRVSPAMVGDQRAKETR